MLAMIWNRMPAERYRRLLSVGNVYWIQNFKVQQAGTLYKSVPNDRMISFKFMTSVKLIESGCERIKMEKFHFVRFDQLHTHVGNITNLIGKFFMLNQIPYPLFYLTILISLMYNFLMCRCHWYS